MWTRTPVIVNTLQWGIQTEDFLPGASRYRSSGSNDSRGNQEYADPFTGASRYRSTGSTSVPAPPSGDPFTGASRYNPSAAASSTSNDVVNLLPMVCCHDLNSSTIAEK